LNSNSTINPQPKIALMMSGGLTTKIRDRRVFSFYLCESFLLCCYLLFLLLFFQVEEYLRLEYKTRRYLEDILGKPLPGSILEAVRKGTIFEFILKIRPQIKVTYNQNPKTPYHYIDNIACAFIFPH
jgi:hypothetical protein